jgi:hypothetical protein
MLKPDPRSGCQLAPSADGVIVFGGYSMARVKGDVFKGQQHADTWLLELKGGAAGDDGAPAPAAAAAKPGDGWVWGKIKCGGVEPNLKSGASMTIRAADGRGYVVYHHCLKNNILLFYLLCLTTKKSSPKRHFFFESYGIVHACNRV